LINYVYPQKPLDGGTTLEPHEDTGADEQLLRKPLVKYAKEVDVDIKIHAR